MAASDIYKRSLTEEEGEVEEEEEEEKDNDEGDEYLSWNTAKTSKKAGQKCQWTNEELDDFVDVIINDG